MNIGYIISSILAFVFISIVSGGAEVGAKYAAMYFIARIVIQLVIQVRAAKPVRRTCFQ